MVGYIGTHPPVKWSTGEWLMPFGFPWTFPHDPGLEEALYQQMVSEAPRLHRAAERPSGYVQRFRGSWARHREFLEARGWRNRWTMTLMARPARADPAALNLAKAFDGNVEALAALVGGDAVAKSPPNAERLKRALDGGWVEAESLFVVEGRGAFEIEARPPHGEVRLLHTLQAAEGDEILWNAMSARAAELGARDVYVTVAEDETARREQLERHGFRAAETGTFPVLAVG